MRRVLIVIVVVIIGAVAGVLSWRLWTDRIAHERMDRGLNTIKIGMSRGHVRQILGPPTSEEGVIADPFTPSTPACKRRSASAFVYQSPRQQSLVIFFDRDQHVACVEQMMAFRIMRQWLW
jgi:type II secretory pathway pseudopilin PulG